MSTENILEKKMFQFKLDNNIRYVIQLMASYKNMSMTDYLNNFFKDFLICEAENIGTEYLVNEIKQWLDKVPYVTKKPKNSL